MTLKSTRPSRRHGLLLAASLLLAAVAPPAALTAPPDVEITTEAVSAQIAGGQTAQFQVVVKNAGSVDATPFVVTAGPDGPGQVALTTPTESMLTDGILDGGETWTYDGAANSILAQSTAGDPCTDVSRFAVIDDDPQQIPAAPLQSTMAVVQTLCGDVAVSVGPAGSTIPGTGTSWQITVTNNGPDALPAGAALSVTPPAFLSGAALACTIGGCTTTSGMSATTDALAAGASATYTLSGTIPPAQTGTLAASASASAPAGTHDPTTPNTQTASVPLTPTGDIAVAVIEGAVPNIPGDTVYTPGLTHGMAFTVTNAAGPSTMRTTPVVSGIATLSAPFTWTCSGPAGACVANGTGTTLPALTLDPGEAATITVTGVTSAAALAPATMTLTADPAAGHTDNGLAPNNSASDSDAALPTGDLQVSLGRVANPGSPPSYTYTLTVHNAGPSNLIGVTVSDVLPDSLGPVSWTCSAGQGSACGGPSGNGNTLAEVVNVAKAESVVYTINAFLEPSPPPVIYNSASATAAPGTVDPNVANNAATSPLLGPGLVEVITTITDGRTTYVPGLPVSYTVQVVNVSPPASGPVTIPVSVPVPPELANASWTCTASGAGSSCGAGGGSGSITAVSVTLAAGGGRTTFSLNGTSASSATDPLALTATAGPPPNDVSPENNVATDTDAAAPSADVAVTLTDGSGSYVPGLGITYTLRATNNGPSDAPAVAIASTLPAGLTAIAWACQTGCAASGTGNVATIAALPAGAQTVIQVTGQTSATERRTLTASASAQAMASPAPPPPDPVPANNAAQDTDGPNPLADVSVAITDSSATYTPGAAVAYRVVVQSAGPSSVAGVRVQALIADALRNPRWSCVSGCAGSGTGPLDHLVDVLPGGRVELSVAADAPASAGGDITSVASIASPAGSSDLAPGNNAAADTDSPRALTDLTLTMTTSTPRAVIGGADVTQTITVANDGPSNATGVALSYTLPSGLRQVSISTPQGRCQGIQEISCQLGALASGARIQIRVSLAAVAPGRQASAASLGGDQADPSRQNNQATDAITVDLAPAQAAGAPAARTSLAVIVQGPSALRPGIRARYLITVTNTGRTAARNLRVSASVPLGTRLLRKSQLAGTSGRRPLVRWTLARLRPGTARTFVLDLVVLRSGAAAPPLAVRAENLLRAPRIRRIQLSARSAERGA